MDQRTFKTVGWSTINGVQKIRFTNDKYRQRALERNGQSNIHLFDLPEDMNKERAVQFLIEKRDTPAVIKNLGKLFLESISAVEPTTEAEAAPRPRRGRPPGSTNTRKAKTARKRVAA